MKNKTHIYGGFWHKERNIFQYNRVESPETDLQKYIHLTDDKDVTAVHRRMEGFSVNDAGSTRHPSIWGKNGSKSLTYITYKN